MAIIEQDAFVLFDFGAGSDEPPLRFHAPCYELYLKAEAAMPAQRRPTDINDVVEHLEPVRGVVEKMRWSVRIYWVLKFRLEHLDKTCPAHVSRDYAGSAEHYKLFVEERKAHINEMGRALASLQAWFRRDLTIFPPQD